MKRIDLPAEPPVRSAPSGISYRWRNNMLEAQLDGDSPWTRSAFMERSYLDRQDERRNLAVALEAIAAAEAQPTETVFQTDDDMQYRVLGGELYVRGVGEPEGPGMWVRPVGSFADYNAEHHAAAAAALEHAASKEK